MIDNDKADLASRSASSLPRMLVWLGIALWDLIFLILNFLFYTLDLYVWKNNDRIIDFVFIFLNCLMARYNGRLHCIVGVLPTCYKRKAATYFYPPGGTGHPTNWKNFEFHA